MLRREDAEKRLQKFQIKDWDKKCLAALAKLPARPCAIGRGLLRRDAEGKPIREWDKERNAQIEAGHQLAALSADARRKVFAALFPRLAPHVENAWQLIARLPYEIGYERKGFRAPNDAAIQQNARAVRLCQILDGLKGYDPDIAWVAAWAPYLGYGGGDAAGILLAAAIDAGGSEGEEVFRILRESATNEHEIGSMGRHVTRGLLVASRPDGWEFIEKLLLAAQRQEGLRQVILETIDEAHPQAFRCMVRLILEHNLLRFSATVRAVDVWFGFGWDAITAGAIKKNLETMLGFLDDVSARQEAIANGDPQSLYFALWTLAFEDAVAAIAPAAQLLAEANVERRFVAAHFLRQLDLPAAKTELVRCLDDDDLRLAVLAADNLPEEGTSDLFDRLQRLLERIPDKVVDLPALVWPWMRIRTDRSTIADQLVGQLGKRPLAVLTPYLRHMSGWGRRQVIERIKSDKQFDDVGREMLFALLGYDTWLREEVLGVLKKCSIAESDALRLEGFLTRKNADLRRAVLTLLQKQKTPAVLVGADRLLASKNANQRGAGLELLLQLVQSKRAVADCRQRAERYRAQRRHLSEEEDLQTSTILDIERVVPKLDDALGLMGDMQRSPVVAPKARKVTFLTPAAIACLTSLDELIHEHREKPITLEESYQGPEETLLGNITYAWQFPAPDCDKPIETDIVHLPLREVWDNWHQQRSKKVRDRDGLELVRALAWANILDDQPWQKYVKHFGKEWSACLQTLSSGLTLPSLRRAEMVYQILRWLLRLHPPAGASDFLLDAMETAFALVPSKILSRYVNLGDWQQRSKDWRSTSPAEDWGTNFNAYRILCPEPLTAEQKLRLWHLLHWREQPHPQVDGMPPDVEITLDAYVAGAANDADILSQLLVREEGNDDFNEWRQVTALKPPAVIENCPSLRALLDRCRERILEIELTRGEMPTAASQPALNISSLFGADTLFRALAALGSKPLARLAYSYGQGRTEVLSHFVRITHPAACDTPEAFATRIKEARIAPERLLQLAFLAPQWVKHIEYALGWEGLTEGVWWFLAHMPGGHQGVATDDEDEIAVYEDEEETSDKRQCDPWERIIQERTPLTAQERAEGAVDPNWFHRLYAPLGKKRWLALGEAAKFGCSGQAHKKAIQLAEVLLGRAKKNDLIAGIRQRQLRESVRLLGLLPLPSGERRDKDLLQRYRVIQEYRRYARGLSAMSRESAVRAGDIGLENLARTAGYADPIRLEWAMEAKEVADLAAGALAVTHQGVTVTLALDEQAQPQITVQRGDKALKNVPSTIRKLPKIAQMLERKNDLKRQASRLRLSLENAMCRGDTFTAAELRQLFEHPMLAPALERLVLLGEGIAGYATAGGQGLTGHDGKIEPIKPNETLRLAHPYDLFVGGEWHLWQKHLFATERVQPFKQVFRELYLLTEQERTDGNVSHRYAGHQVNPQQALALFGSRGWGVQEEVRKIYHEVGLVAEVTFRSGAWTPLEMEGLTLEGVSFRRRGEWKPMPLAEVPPRIFSEAMRDVDLVVSVAHLGGVDPEASASTVAMREALLRETLSLLKIDNVRYEKSHALIDGSLGTYSVHLGSAVVHRQPGGALCIVPVHAQQRGRLFLPFADDDPRSAEVLSKVILLARDHDIQDPSILEQIR